MEIFDQNIVKSLCKKCNKFSSNDTFFRFCCQNYLSRPKANFSPCFGPLWISVLEITSGPHPLLNTPLFFSHWRVRVLYPLAVTQFLDDPLNRIYRVNQFISNFFGRRKKRSTNLTRASRISKPMLKTRVGRLQDFAVVT